MAEERGVTQEQEIATYEFLRVRKRNYQLTFGPMHGQEVLRDLAEFCRANDSCFDDTTGKSLERLEGRREVFLRIQRQLQLNPDMLYALSTGRSFKYVLTEEKTDEDGLAELIGE